MSISSEPSYTGSPAAAKKSFWKNVSYVAASITAWWIPSLGLTAANKMIFSDYQFPFPVTVTCFHFSCTALILVSVFHGGCSKLTVPVCSWKRYKWNVIPIAALAATDIVFSRVGQNL